MTKLRWKRGVLQINENEIHIIELLQLLGILLVIWIAFVEGTNFKTQQEETIKKYCGTSYINLSQPRFSLPQIQNKSEFIYNG